MNELIPVPDGQKKTRNLDNIPAFVNFSQELSYPPKSDSNILRLTHPVVIKPYENSYVDFEHFGRKNFEALYKELPDKDFSRWGMKLEIKSEDTGDSVDVTRFGTTINLRLDESAYIKLKPHSRYGLAGGISNTIAVLAYLPEKAFAKVHKDGLAVYQLIQPGDHFMIEHKKVLLPGSVLLNNKELWSFKCEPRHDLINAQLYDANDRFFAMLPDSWNRTIDAMHEGRINPQSVVFSNF
jgi:hypothetical protein